MHCLLPANIERSSPYADYFATELCPILYNTISY